MIGGWLEELDSSEFNGAVSTKFEFRLATPMQSVIQRGMAANFVPVLQSVRSRRGPASHQFKKYQMRVVLWFNNSRSSNSGCANEKDNPKSQHAAGERFGSPARSRRGMAIEVNRRYLSA